MEEPLQFEVLMSKSYIIMVVMHLPGRIIKFMPDKVEVIFLQGDRGSWPVAVGRSEGIITKFTSGWRKFITDNGLKEGDHVLFQFSERGDAIVRWEVRIIRRMNYYDVLYKPQRDEGTSSNPSKEINMEGNEEVARFESVSKATNNLDREVISLTGEIASLEGRLASLKESLKGKEAEQKHAEDLVKAAEKDVIDDKDYLVMISIIDNSMWLIN